MTKTKLVPPDKKRCQAVKVVGAFMFGPPKTTRCERRPIYIAYETKPGADGIKGSMSLCGECAKVCIEQMATSVLLEKLKGSG